MSLGQHLGLPGLLLLIIFVQFRFCLGKHVIEKRSLDDFDESQIIDAWSDEEILQDIITELSKRDEIAREENEFETGNSNSIENEDTNRSEFEDVSKHADIAQNTDVNPNGNSADEAASEFSDSGSGDLSNESDVNDTVDNQNSDDAGSGSGGVPAAISASQYTVTESKLKKGYGSPEMEYEMTHNAPDMSKDAEDLASMDRGSGSGDLEKRLHIPQPSLGKLVDEELDDMEEMSDHKSLETEISKRSQIPKPEKKEYVARVTDQIPKEQTIPIKQGYGSPDMEREMTQNPMDWPGNMGSNIEKMSDHKSLENEISKRSQIPKPEKKEYIARVTDQLPKEQIIPIKQGYGSPDMEREMTQNPMDWPGNMGPNIEKMSDHKSLEIELSKINQIPKPEKKEYIAQGTNQIPKEEIIPIKPKPGYGSSDMEREMTQNAPDWTGNMGSNIEKMSENEISKINQIPKREKKEYIAQGTNQIPKEEITPIKSKPGYGSPDMEREMTQNAPDMSSNFEDMDLGSGSGSGSESVSSGSGSGSGAFVRDTIIDPPIKQYDVTMDDDLNEASRLERRSKIRKPKSRNKTAIKERIDRGFDTFEEASDEARRKFILKNNDDSAKDEHNILPNSTKRQFIARPHLPFIVRDGYVYLKAPPMTQKTIVTTHIPRPPMMMPYERFLNRYLHGGFRRNQQYSEEDDDGYEREHERDRYEHEHDEGHCESDPCMNGATCNEVKDGYECICPTGFKGTDCEEEDKCHPNPCHNTGVCTEANGMYVCTCPQGFKGLNCQEVNKCQPNPCHNGGICNEVNSDFECVCISEYTGKDCGMINHCHMTPCLNGGTCTSNYGIGNSGLVSCMCPLGYSGPRCEVRDKCRFTPCKNGGNCREGNCNCITGFTGEYCEVPPSPCSVTPCLNGGTCMVRGLTEYKCICRHGYRGSNCEVESHCDPNPCLNGAGCLDVDDGYKCECSHKFKGTHCEDEISPCDTNPCLNEGTCVVEYTKYKCLCRPGYKGMNCEGIDHCHERPCKNGGICMSETEDVKCQCMEGYRGLLCEDQDRCFPNPCLNGGTCFENMDGFTCTCTAGYRGTHCTDRDPCHPNVCLHNGICIAEGDSFHCTCENGWTGLTCENEDRCHPNPCLHGGVCVSRGGSSYECHCPSGFAGINCEVGSISAVAAPPSPFSAIPRVLCRNSRYGCCPDGDTSSSGPNGVGCPAFFHP